MTTVAILNWERWPFLLAKDFGIIEAVGISSVSLGQILAHLLEKRVRGVVLVAFLASTLRTSSDMDTPDLWSHVLMAPSQQGRSTT